MTQPTSETRRAVRIAAIQGAILTVLCLLAFRNQVLALLEQGIRDRESAHMLVAPLLVALLIYLRRDALSKAFTGGSPWGFAVIIAALVSYSLARWFNYAYPQRTSIVLGIAGVVLAVGGWRVLRLCLPMLLVLLLAVPMTARHYARMIILPETLTLQAVRATLDLLPGIFVELDGSDLSFFGSGKRGTIALGESYRGASLFLAYLTIGAFVAGSRLRPLWQGLGIAAAAVPIMLLCNYARLLIWGLWTIWTGAGALDAAPRLVATPLSLLLAYGLFVGTAAALAKMLQSAPTPRSDHVRPDQQPA